MLISSPYLFCLLFAQELWDMDSPLSYWDNPNHLLQGILVLHPNISWYGYYPVIEWAITWYANIRSSTCTSQLGFCFLDKVFTMSYNSCNDYMVLIFVDFLYYINYKAVLWHYQNFCLSWYASWLEYHRHGNHLPSKVFATIYTCWSGVTTANLIWKMHPSLQGYFPPHSYLDSFWWSLYITCI